MIRRLPVRISALVDAELAVVTTCSGETVARDLYAVLAASLATLLAGSGRRSRSPVQRDHPRCLKGV